MMEDRDDGDGDVEAGGAEAREGDRAPDIIQPFDLPLPSADRRRSGCLRLRARAAASRRWCFLASVSFRASVTFCLAKKNSLESCE